MNVKNEMSFTDAGGHNQMVKLFVMLSRDKTLEWVDPYGENKRPSSFLQKIDKVTGARVYEVPLPYACRLLAAEPYKYFLCYPDILTVRFDVKGGGKEVRKVRAKTVKYVEGSIYKDQSGDPPQKATIINVNEDLSLDIDVDGRLIKSVGPKKVTKGKVVEKLPNGLPVLVDKYDNEEE